MTDDEHDFDETRSRTLREANRAISRRTALGVGGAVGTAGLLAWLMGVDIPSIFAPGDEGESAADGPGDSVWSVESQAHQRIAESRPTLSPSFEYEPLSVRAGPDDSGPVSAIGAEPATEGSGDRVLVAAEESSIPNLETLLVSRFTTGERVTTQEITIEDRTVPVRIFSRDDLWMGVGRHGAPDIDGEAELLVARSTSRDTLREIIESYPAQYDQLRPV